MTSFKEISKLKSIIRSIEQETDNYYSVFPSSSPNPFTSTLYNSTNIENGPASGRTTFINRKLDTVKTVIKHMGEGLDMSQVYPEMVMVILLFGFPFFLL